MSDTPRMNMAKSSNERYSIGCQIERELAEAKAELAKVREFLGTREQLAEVFLVVASLSKSLKDGESAVGWCKRILSENDHLKAELAKVQEDFDMCQSDYKCLAERWGEALKERDLAQDELAKVREENEWKPASKKPDQGFHVLVWHGNQMDMGYFMDYDWSFVIGNDLIENVKYWRELPKPPRIEEVGSELYK